MGCCGCSCINKLDHVEKVINDYDPNETFIDYKLLTVWLNRKTKQAYILVSKENGIATWIPVNLDINAIEKVLLDCGEIQPNEKGEVRVKGQCGVYTAAEGCENFYFDLFTADPLTGGKRVYLGDEVNLGFRADIAGDVRGPDSATVGNVPVYKDTTGKTITTSNINSTDGLTSITKSTAGEQKLLVETVDSESGSNAGVEAKSTGSGAPYFQLTQGDNKWRRQINPETGVLEIRPVDDLSKDSIMNFLPNGIVTGNLQPKASARLTQSTPVFERNKWIQVGSNLAFQKLRDEDGYNKSANNFFPGDGAGNGAYYTVPYTGVWAIQFQFLIDQSINKTGTRILYRLTWGNQGSYQSLRNAYQLAFKYQSLSDCRLLPLEKGNICFLEVRVDDNDESVKPFIYAESDQRSIDSYIGFFLVYG